MLTVISFFFEPLEDRQRMIKIKHWECDAFNNSDSAKSDYAVANWNTPNDSMKKSGPVGDVIFNMNILLGFFDKW